MKIKYPKFILVLKRKEGHLISLWLLWWWGGGGSALKLGYIQINSDSLMSSCLISGLSQTAENRIVTTDLLKCPACFIASYFLRNVSLR